MLSFLSIFYVRGGLACWVAKLRVPWTCGKDKWIQFKMLWRPWIWELATWPSQTWQVNVCFIAVSPQKTLNWTWFTFVNTSEVQPVSEEQSFSQQHAADSSVPLKKPGRYSLRVIRRWQAQTGACCQSAQLNVKPPLRSEENWERAQEKQCLKKDDRMWRLCPTA